MIARLLAGALLLVGLWGVLALPNLVKKVVALAIANSAVILLFVLGGSSLGDRAPILSRAGLEVVDPVPQALMLTAIVVGVSVTALALCLAVGLYERFGTLDADKIERRLRDEP